VRQIFVDDNILQNNTDVERVATGVDDDEQTVNARLVPDDSEPKPDDSEPKPDDSEPQADDSEPQADDSEPKADDSERRVKPRLV